MDTDMGQGDKAWVPALLGHFFPYLAPQLLSWTSMDQPTGY